MARDFEDIHGLDDLSDDELRGLVRDRLRDHAGIDVDDISVNVEQGMVRLQGRVGTEAEARVAERVLTDSLGIIEVHNELVVDPIRRAVSPEAIDDHLVDEADKAGLLLGERPDSHHPEAEHLAEHLDEEIEGTVDVQRAIEDGETWIPPESPTPEGMSGTDAGPGVYGEDH